MSARKLAIDFLTLILTKSYYFSSLLQSDTFPVKSTHSTSMAFPPVKSVNFCSLVSKYMNSKAINTAVVSTAYLGEMTDSDFLPYSTPMLLFWQGVVMIKADRNTDRNHALTPS